MADLTPNQIVDALRKCVCDDTCIGCPYWGPIGCREQLMSDAASAIEGLQALSK